MIAISRFIAAARTSWIVLVAGIAATAALFVVAGYQSADSAPPVGLPDSAESIQAANLQEQFRDDDSTSGILVFGRESGELSADDVAAITVRAGELGDIALDGFVPPTTVSEDGTTALVAVPLEIEERVSVQAERADEIRSIAADGLPDGIEVWFTGAEGFLVDISAVFEGANFVLLGVTALVVAVLLIITYRSPILWIVPLGVVGVADVIAGIAARLVADAAGITLDGSVTGILSVLVFGAGTNYALLLIARYRDELRLHADRREAMAIALRGAGPAIIASGSTVALALATLLFGELSGNRSLGLAGAVGIVVAMAYALLVLPAALVVFGRWLFWPLVPRYGTPDTISRSPWGRLGRSVSTRPVIVAIAGFAVLAAFASGLTTLTVGLSQNDRFIVKPEAVLGQERLAEAFSAGSTAPAAVIVPAADAAEVSDGLAEVDGVVEVRPGPSDDDIAQLDIVLDADPESQEAFAIVSDVRLALDDLGDGSGLVGGIDAEGLDLRDAQQRDQNLVIPLILVLVLAVLIVLLRSLLAPVLLLLAVVASFFSAVGIGSILFETVFGFPGVDTNVLLFSFLFLVALGVDYSIFLVTRAQEEVPRLGTSEGMVRALAATGGVITSAGVLLAAVFAVLGVLPLITLTQVGVIVCIGVLIDTLLVRTVIVPAMTFIAKDRFWWPRRPELTDAEAAARGANGQAERMPDDVVDAAPPASREAVASL
ncbi:MMPL family transporter [Microcella alkalica]|uniref:RND superfamily putative drug exporter n=1 Tax=Microcella alkalica TaxID=355930 RepID=A0A839E4J9_9MICO|nr:MMPL family transporter [Microcella alkalica]MBA8847301.1 RND superfamily putative drug exporter [Microcella alkalica]